MLFLRNDVVGFDIGGSLAQQGLQFNLGVTNRNLALIPVYAAGANGQVVRITGGGADGQGANPSRDAMSVLGQFKMNTETTRLGFGLDRYFATGVAARNLGESMQAAIAKVPVENAAPQTALATVTSAAGTK